MFGSQTFDNGNAVLLVTERIYQEKRRQITSIRTKKTDAVQLFFFFQHSVLEHSFFLLWALSSDAGSTNVLFNIYNSNCSNYVSFSNLKSVYIYINIYIIENSILYTYFDHIHLPAPSANSSSITSSIFIHTFFLLGGGGARP